jgi:hypothetical protein
VVHLRIAQVLKEISLYEFMNGHAACSLSRGLTGAR